MKYFASMKSHIPTQLVRKEQTCLILEPTFEDPGNNQQTYRAEKSDCDLILNSNYDELTASSFKSSILSKTLNFFFISPQGKGSKS